MRKLVWLFVLCKVFKVDQTKLLAALASGHTLNEVIQLLSLVSPQLLRDESLCLAAKRSIHPSVSRSLHLSAVWCWAGSRLCVISGFSIENCLPTVDTVRVVRLNPNTEAVGEADKQWGQTHFKAQSCTFRSQTYCSSVHVVHFDMVGLLIISTLSSLKSRQSTESGSSWTWMLLFFLWLGQQNEFQADKSHFKGIV